jgi:hypothetical protein
MPPKILLYSVDFRQAYIICTFVNPNNVRGYVASSSNPKYRLIKEKVSSVYLNNIVQKIFKSMY